MRDSIKMVLVLAVISALAGLILAASNSFTEPKIAANLAATEAAAYRDVLTTAETFIDDEAMLAQAASTGITAVKQGQKAGQPVGWVCKVAVPGYGGNIELLVGIDTAGMLQKVLVLSQTETPGLGANITTDEFIGQSALFESNGEELKVTKDGGKVQAVTGATISSRAVLDGVNRVFKLYSLSKAN